MRWKRGAALCCVGLAVLVLAAGGCGTSPTAADLGGQAASPAGPAGNTRLTVSDYEIMIEGDGCTKTWQEDRYIMINGGPDRCICNVTTTCPGATYSWSSSAYTCYAGSCRG